MIVCRASFQQASAVFGVAPRWQELRAGFRNVRFRLHSQRACFCERASQLRWSYLRGCFRSSGCRGRIRIPGQERRSLASRTREELGGMLCAGGALFRFVQLGDAKVQNLDRVAAAAVWLEPNVFGFQITMNDPLLVCFVERRARLFQNVYHPIERQARFFFEDFIERVAVQILHYQVRNLILAYLRKAKIRDIHDVGMTQASRRPCFAPEALDKLFVLHELWRDDLEGDWPLRAQVGRRIDCAHAAFAELFLDAVLTVQHLANEFCCCHEGSLNDDRAFDCVRDRYLFALEIVSLKKSPSTPALHFQLWDSNSVSCLRLEHMALPALAARLSEGQ